MPIYKDPKAPSEAVVNEVVVREITLSKRYLDKRGRKKEVITYQQRNAGGSNCDPNHLDINEVTFLVNEECIVLYFEP